MKINFASSKDDSNEICIMCIIITFWISFAKLSKGFRRTKERKWFVFDSVDLFYYNLNKISLVRKGRLYIDSPKWLKNKKARVNPKNNDDKCF